MKPQNQIIMLMGGGRNHGQCIGTAAIVILVLIVVLAPLAAIGTIGGLVIFPAIERSLIENEGASDRVAYIAGACVVAFICVVMANCYCMCLNVAGFCASMFND